MNSKNTMVVVIAFSTLVVLLQGIRTCTLSSERDGYAKRNQQLEQEVKDYAILKAYFQQQLDSLEHTCDDLARANAEAQLKLMERNAKTRKKKSE